MLGSLQSETVSHLPGDGIAPVHSDHLLSLVGSGVALLASVPFTTMILEDSVGCGVITVNRNVEDVSLAPMTTSSMMDVNVPLLCFPLKPFGCDKAATVVRIEGLLVGGCRGANAFVRAVNFGLPATATACGVTNQVVSPCKGSLAIPTSVVLRNCLDVADQECMAFVETHCQNRLTNFVIVGRKVGYNEITVWLNRVSGNTLFEVLFKQRQMPVGQTVTQAWVSGEESFRKFAGSSHVVSYMGTPMNSNAAEEAVLVPIGVERKDSALVAKPIRKTPKAKIQRLAIQDDFDIEHLGLLVSPLGVGSSLVFKTQFFLLFHPVPRRCKCPKPGKRLKVLVVRKLFSIYHVSQLDLSADLEHEARFDALNDLALDLVSDKAFQIPVKAKQNRPPTLFYNVFAPIIDLVELLAGMLWVVQGIKPFHKFVRKSLLPYDLLLFVKPSRQLLLCKPAPSSH